jgi:hypothetical protein
MPEPYEILAGPVTLYYAPVGTAMPAIDAAPSGSWSQIGSNGAFSYSGDGVTMEDNVSINTFRSLANPGALKKFISEEDAMIRLLLADSTLEAYAVAMNFNTVTTVAAGVGTAGYKKVGLSRGGTLRTRALLLRWTGISPYGDGWNMQRFIPLAQPVGSPQPVSRLADPMVYAVEFAPLVDPDAASDDEVYGVLIAQHADAET